jgi:hypothetical protein
MRIRFGAIGDWLVPFMGLKKSEWLKLDSEVISNDARLRLTRMIRN